MRAIFRRRSRHKPSSTIHLRKVSADKASPWISRNFSQANVGPKSGYLSLTSEMTRVRNSDVKALLGRCPRRRETSPWGPSIRSRWTRRFTCRIDIPIRSAACSWVIWRLTESRIIWRRSSSLRLMLMVSFVMKYPAWEATGTFQNGSKGTLLHRINTLTTSLALRQLRGYSVGV